MNVSTLSCERRVEGGGESGERVEGGRGESGRSGERVEGGG